MELLLERDARRPAPSGLGPSELGEALAAIDWFAPELAEARAPEALGFGLWARDGQESDWAPLASPRETFDFLRSELLAISRARAESGSGSDPRGIFQEAGARLWSFAERRALMELTAPGGSSGRRAL